ncbi:MAG TPA: hypothetical protein VFQ79_22285 [Bryobacteraceae bacterium]|nr:hypothetical protein [Bryobacteraceae bacterium]
MAATTATPTQFVLTPKPSDLLLTKPSSTNTYNAVDHKNCEVMPLGVVIDGVDEVTACTNHP